MSTIRAGCDRCRNGRFCAELPLRIACKESDETFTSEPKLIANLKPVQLGTVLLKRRAN
jgi:hypothetical protein